MSTAFGCVGNTIRLYSGGYLDLANPKPDQFELIDIAKGLSNICRFGGQIGEFYSVAQHCVSCHDVAERDGCSPEQCLAVLMHDAAEAFVGDMVKPLKELITGFVRVEDRIQDCIAAKFGIDFAAHKDVIREIDHAVLIAERRMLFSVDKTFWHGEDTVRNVRYAVRIPKSPMDAEDDFYSVAKQLLGVKA